MSDPTPNAKQRQLIQGIDGVYLVDAGPGTGKTFTITRRYTRIVEQPNVEPDDVLLVTFTRNAATEMKERIVDESGYGMRNLADAPIQTFHSFCHDLLNEFGYQAPSHLGLDESITGSTRLIEDELLEKALFEEFYSRFRDDHPEHADFYRIITEPSTLLSLIHTLTAKGVFPTRDGWYRNSERHLTGDFDAFRERFDAVNQPRNGGRKQSELRAGLNRFGSTKAYLPDAPSKQDIRGGRGTKAIDDAFAEEVFHEERTDLTRFVHDLYFEYLEFALERNYLTFGFLQLFAFVLLCEDEHVRESRRFDYVMIDEFQDSSEIQFKLALLVAGSDNFCVVGDWKQSIYGFQDADVMNIVDFGNRITRFTEDLNDDSRRVYLQTDEIERIELEENYRSTQTLIDFAETALETPATSSDSVDTTSLPDIVSLSSNRPFDETTIRGVQAEEEPEAVLTLIQEIVDNDDYAVEDENGHPRPPTYDDIAVFTRTRDFGRELLDVADEHAFPMAYDGGIELFRTDPAKVLLAWLRILTQDGDRGWALVLEEAGYTLDEIKHILETETYPVEMARFRDELESLETIGGVARRVFRRYGFADERTDTLLDTIQSIYDTTTFVPGDLIRLMERGIEEGTIRDITTSTGSNSVTVQTIHAAKGLEYPIVILANMNYGSFPPSGGGSPVISFQDPVGLRQRKRYAEVHAYPHVYDNWRRDVIRQCIQTDYDEERRLLYVAITRAKHHMLFTCGEKPNTFLESLVDELATIEPAIGSVPTIETEQTDLPFTIQPSTGPIEYSPHTLMDERIFEESGESDAFEFDPHVEPSGAEFGANVHEFAEEYAEGKAVTPKNEHEERIAAFLDGLPGELYVEESIRLPLEVDGQSVMLTGVADLVHVADNHVEIIDYKTDATRRAEAEYEKQLSVYYHVVAHWFDPKPVSAKIFYTGQNEVIEMKPLELSELRELVSSAGQ